MQFGLFMMPLHPPHRAFADGYDRDIDQIVLADRLGFREAWVGEHLTERWENAPAPDLLIAKALALTKTVRLGTGVTLLALHDPVYLAHRLAMLDHMARGRFQWGIGAGRHCDRSLAPGSRPRQSRRRARPVGRGAGRGAQALGVGRPLLVSRQVLRHRHPGIRPGEGPRVLHEALSDAASAHRGGGEHAQVGLHADGGRARLDPHVELAAVPGVSRRPLAPGRGWRGEGAAGRPRGASGASRETSSSRRPRRRRASAPAP